MPIAMLYAMWFNSGLLPPPAASSSIAAGSASGSSRRTRDLLAPGKRRYSIRKGHQSAPGILPRCTHSWSSSLELVSLSLWNVKS